ncbi:hypothetical protein BGP76_00230 [Reichenbachiella sp. MSK19-1]|nr:hypothetical protein BGP76_00230 [Reichenbachiella sp. MSK19-1]
MVSVLVKIFGTENFSLAEDVVQEALLAGLEAWKYKGMPENPSAWLYRVAKNKAIDVLRRKRFDQSFDFSDPERQLLISEYTMGVTMDNYFEDDSIKDDFLGMMYACCHPALSEENQVTFILKSLCGFSTREVASAFLTTEDTISKRLYRTKEFFRQEKLRPAIPNNHELPSKTAAVLKAIYLLFNEGYRATHMDEHIRQDLISQALHLCKALLNHPETQLPSVYALMALMCFHTARSDSRIDAEGNLVLLQAQDRKLWSQELIAMGNYYMNQSAFGDNLTTYHLEAALAYEHCASPSYEETDWARIVAHYDALLALSSDHVVSLNRCAALLELEGAIAAQHALELLQSDRQLQHYCLYHATLGEVQLRLGNQAHAIQSFEKALSLTSSRQEKAFLSQKISVCRS